MFHSSSYNKTYCGFKTKYLSINHLLTRKFSMCKKYQIVYNQCSSFISNQEYPKLIHGVRICVDLPLLNLTFSLCPPSWEKRTVFHSSLQAENYFGQVVFKPDVFKSFVSLFYCMSTSPVPNSVIVSPVESSTSPSVFYFDFSVTGWSFACIWCTVLQRGTAYVLFSKLSFLPIQIFIK